jgi:hypothetical protein
VGGGTIAPPVAPPVVVPPPDRPVDRTLADDIDNWARGGTLENYQEFPRLLAGLFQTFIDWQAYGIGALQLSDRLVGRRFYIEGQAGRSSSGDYYTLTRSPELSAVLHALAELDKGVQPHFVGTHLANLSTWVRNQEADIVAFVSKPMRNAEPPVDLPTQLVLDGLLIEVLGGGLNPAVNTPVELYLNLISSCTMPTPWNKQLAPTAGLRSTRWSDLCTRLGADNKVAQLRAWCLVALNCPQGDFSMEKQKVRFLDAATALDILDDFLNNGWTLPAWESLGPSMIRNWPPAWAVGAEIYLALRDHFAAVIAADVQQMRAWLDRIAALLGGESAEVVFAAIRDLEGTLRQYQQPHNFVIRDLSPNKLRDLQAWFTSVTQAPSAAQQILQVSSAGSHLQAGREYRDYLNAAYEFADQTERKFAQQRKQEESRINSGSVDRLAEREYEEIETLLSRGAGKKSP